MHSSSEKRAWREGSQRLVQLQQRGRQRSDRGLRPQQRGRLLLLLAARGRLLPLPAARCTVSGVMYLEEGIGREEGLAAKSKGQCESGGRGPGESPGGDGGGGRGPGRGPGAGGGGAESGGRSWPHRRRLEGRPQEAQARATTLRSGELRCPQPSGVPAPLRQARARPCVVCCGWQALRGGRIPRLVMGSERLA